MTEMTAVMAALAELRSEADVRPGEGWTARARAAMHEARRAPRRRFGAALVVEAVRRHLTLVSVSVATATAAATVLALGWSAPAGSPLHPIRLAQERVALALPGVDRAALELGDAEGRLQDAQAGRNPGPSLDEAASLLAAAQGDLPADHAAPDWQRWERDEATLEALRERGVPGVLPVTPLAPAPAGSGPGTRPGTGGDDRGAPGGPGGGAVSGGGEGFGERSGDGGGSGAPAGTSGGPGPIPTEGSRGGDNGGGGGGGSVSTSTSSTSAGGSDGGGGGGGSTTTTSSTSTTDSRTSTSTSQTSSDGGGRDASSGGGSSTSSTTDGGGSTSSGGSGSH